MKVKFTLKLILFIVLLACTNGATLRRRKKKFLDPVSITLTILSIIGTGVGVAITVKSHATNKKMFEIYSAFLNQVEGIERAFLDSIFKTCIYAMNANVLNSAMLFHFELNLQKLKFSLPQYKSDFKLPEKSSLDELLNSLEAAVKKHVENKEQTEKKLEKKIGTFFTAKLVQGFTQMEAEMKGIIELDMKTKEEICFGKAYTDSLFEKKKMAFKGIDEAAEALEDIGYLLSALKDGDKETEDYRKIWLERAGQYMPEKVEGIEQKIADNPRWWRITKGLLELFEYFIPFFGKDDNEKATAGDVAKVSSLVRQGSLRKAALKILDMIKGQVEAALINKIAEHILGSIGAIVNPLYNSFKSIKKLVESSQKVAKLSIQMKTELGIQKVEAENLLRVKNLEVINMCQNAILEYKMLKLITFSILKLKLPTPKSLEFQTKFKQICSYNLNLCKAETGVNYIQTNFSNKKICPKDVYISKNDEHELNLFRNKFVLFEDKEKLLGEYGIYQNFFFSVSKSVVLDIRIEQKETKVKDIILKIIGKIEECKEGKCSELNKAILVQELKIDDKFLYITKAPIKLLNDHVRAVFCRDRNEILNLTDQKALRRQNSTHSIFTKDPKVEHAKQTDTLAKGDNQLENAYNVVTLENHFLKDVCKLVVQQIEVFTEAEKDEMKKVLPEIFTKTSVDKYTKEGEIFNAKVASMVRISLKTGTNFRVSALDALLILYNRVVDGKTVQFREVKGEPWVKFKLKEFNPKNEFELMTFYSTGNEYCKSHGIIKDPAKDKRGSYQKPEEIAGKQLYDKVKDEFRSYFTDFQSRYDNGRHPFKVNFPAGKDQISFNLYDVVNEGILKYDEKEKKIMLNGDHRHFDGCRYSFQFVRIEVGQAEFGFKYKLNKEVKGFPVVEIERAKQGELGFEGHFNAMFYVVTDDINDQEKEEREMLYYSINKKMANYRNFGLAHMAKSDKLNTGTKVTFNTWMMDLFQGNVYVDVFVKPMEHQSAKDNLSICEGINKH